MIAYFAATRTQCLEKNREKIQVIFFYELNENLNKYITGVGCAAHIIHNAVQTAADLLPADVENIVIKNIFISTLHCAC